MYKDPTEFRKRFAAWKDGKKPYKDGLPAYLDGKEDESYYKWMEDLAEKYASEWTDIPNKVSVDEVLTNMLNDNTYNYRAYYNSKENKYLANQMRFPGSESHFDDIGKTMYHPTFSTYSKYSGKKSDYNPLGIKGGTWEDDNTYRISRDQALLYFNYNATRDYLNRSGGKSVRIKPPTDLPYKITE